MSILKNNQISLLLLEDNEDTCIDFENCINNRNDINLVARTNSSFEAIKLVKHYKPEAIIVDIELTDGSGSGFEFLTDLSNIVLDYIPLVVVNTQVKRDIIYNAIHNGYADIIFYKNQKDYKVDYVLNAIVFSSSKNTNSNKISSSKTSPIEKDENYIRKSELINAELDNIHIKKTLNGRIYMFDALMYMISNHPSRLREATPLQYVASLYNNMTSSTVCRDISNAIKNAWFNNPYDEIEKEYQGHYTKEDGVPTPMEFLEHYANRIRKKF